MQLSPRFSTTLVSLLALAGGALFSGCISTGEHQRQLAEALAAQKADYEKQLRYSQEMRTKEQTDHKQALTQQQDRVKTLEADLNKLGFDLNKTRGELSNQLTATQTQLEQLRRLREQDERNAAALRAVADKLRSMIDAGHLEVVTRKGRMTLKLPDEILFPPGSKKLKADGKEALLAVIDVLKSVEDRDFLIAGHTDNVPVKAGLGFKSNWDLSTARALEVVSLMVDNGVAPQNVAAAGYGEFDPVADNSQPEGRAKNRRLEIILMPRIEALASAE
jgi:chemotaxis protein MotB